jgi:DNA-binding NarL/FixJ family response regulator
MIRVLIVDNKVSTHLKTQMRLATELDIQVVGLAKKGREAVAQIAAAKPDILLMDVQPMIDERETIHQMQQQYPQCKILIFTHCDDGRSIAEALLSGAKGYLLKDTNDLAQSIRLVHQGCALLSPGIWEQLVEQVASGDFLQASRKSRCGRVQSNWAEFERLTRREQQVLRAISQGLNNREISEALALSTSTVRTHICNMSRRLKIEDRSQLKCYANRVFAEQPRDMPEPSTKYR